MYEVDFLKYFYLLIWILFAAGSLAVAGKLLVAASEI